MNDETGTGGDELLRQAAERALRMTREGVPRCDVLTSLALAAEEFAGGGAVVSILVLDGDGLLRHGASPNLPADYLGAIDRLRPNAGLGTCAAAAATGKVVITPDFIADDKWRELRHLPLALGFVAAWSMPIKTAQGRVLGTFGTYFREKRTPRDTEMKGIERLAGAAAAVLEA